ncbi:hypothetical protein Tco_1329722 [Tanacetum coccineum]
MMEADRLLAERIQTRERGELTYEEKGKLFMELMEKRRKHFDALRAQEKRNRPPTKAQKRSQMSTYLKHMGGYKHKQLMGKSYDEIQKLFDKEMKRVNTFVAMSSEAQESNEKKVEGSEEKAKSSRKKSLGKKRAVKEHQQESPKRQKLEDDKETDEHEEVEADDTAELKKHLVIKKDDDIAIDAIPLATKPPMIVEYKLLKEGIMVHFQLIRADGSSKRYSSMIRMLQDIDREDLETLWKLVKTKHGDTRPEDEHERVLLGDFKVMFEPDIRSKVWRDLQGISHLDELHVTWAHLEEKRTRLRTNTKTLEDLCSQSLETASQAIHDTVTTHQVIESQHFMMASAHTDSNADLEDSTYDGVTTKMRRRRLIDIYVASLGLLVNRFLSVSLLIGLRDNVIGVERIPFM